MAIAATETLGPTATDPAGSTGPQNILSWVHADGSEPSGARAYNASDGAEIVIAWTYQVLIPDPSAGVPDNLDISAAHLLVLVGTNDGRKGAGHQAIRVDLGRGNQFTMPANEVNVSLIYPLIPPPVDAPGIFQPKLKINVTLGRGGRGCGCATFTVATPPDGSPVAIPEMAVGATLISPVIPGAPVPFNQYASPNVGTIIEMSDIVSPAIGEIPIAQGALFWDTTGAPAGSRVRFRLGV